MNENQEEKQRSVTWYAHFEILIDEEEKRWDDLTDSEKEYILSCIKEDSLSGLF